ncbi:hypothetical protein BZA70DRAFT_277552 [Myxozyma melibiosi]|uniref:Up-regulated during septation protein 1 domain-containing protein n=1 Tax=Myxozyma melibiosi TaxID=54550 RepID=A0ABR1F851_9ASCO
MSRPLSGLKHSESSLSINTLPMWDSSDPERHPPPLPLATDSPNLTSPSRSGGSFLRSRNNSPVRPTLRPISQSVASSSQASDILLTVGRIQEQLTELDSTVRSSDYTIRKTEKEIESLLRRSKDNAGDLGSLREKVLNTENILHEQLSSITKVLTISPKTLADDIRAFFNDGLRTSDWSSCLDKVNNLEEAMLKLSPSFNVLQQNLGKQRAQRDETLSRSDSQSYNRLTSKIDEMSERIKDYSASLDHVSKGLESVTLRNAEFAGVEKNLLSTLQQVQTTQQIIGQAHEERDGRSDQTLRQLETVLSGELLQKVKGLENNVENNAGRLEMIYENGLSLSNALSEGDIYERSESMKKVISSLATLEEQISGIRQSFDSDLHAAYQSHAAVYEERIQDLSIIQTAGFQKSDTILSTVADLDSIIRSQSERSSSSATQTNAKLDEITSDIKMMSTNIQPLTLLPEIYANFIENATRSATSLSDEHSRLTSEVETLRQQKLDMVKELASLDATVASRAKELKILEDRAEAFQQKLQTSIMSQIEFATVSKTGSSAGREFADKV